MKKTKGAGFVRVPAPGHQERVYIKVTLPGLDNGHIIEVHEVKDLIKDMVKNLVEYDDVQAYTLTPVLMTQKEFKELPDFRGF